MNGEEVNPAEELLERAIWWEIGMRRHRAEALRLGAEGLHAIAAVRDASARVFFRRSEAFFEAALELENRLKV